MVCVCVCVYAYMYGYISKCILCLFFRLGMYVLLYVYQCACVYVCIYVHVCLFSVSLSLSLFFFHTSFKIFPLLFFVATLVRSFLPPSFPPSLPSFLYPFSITFAFILFHLCLSFFSLHLHLLILARPLTLPAFSFLTLFSLIDYASHSLCLK